jgi:hypothetical protein
MQTVIQKGKQTNIPLQPDKTLFADACTYDSKNLNYEDSRGIILLLLPLQPQKTLSV